MNKLPHLLGYHDNILQMGVGSVENQVAELTSSIRHLTKHLEFNKKDYACKLGLKKKVSKRVKLLKYLKEQSVERYSSIISFLGLRK